GEGAYVRYEMWLRDLETAVNSVVGLSGSFFAARRELCRPWPDHLPSDFNVLLNTVKSGRRGVADPASVGYYPNIADEHKEFDRKVRTVLRGLSVVMHNLEFFNPVRYGLFSWQLVSHKLCRWLAPFALVAALMSNGFLLGEGAVYGALLLGQATWYLVAAIGIAWPRRLSHRLVKIPMYFVLVNVSIAAAWCRYVIGQRATTWEPSRREPMSVSAP
ncbi:MAG: glycosyltransferase family 2 protein, partial [Nitrospiria bacterium]